MSFKARSHEGKEQKGLNSVPTRQLDNMRFVRTCKLTQQSKLATRNPRIIRRTRSAAIAKFLEEQSVAKFKKSPVPEDSPHDLRSGKKRTDSPGKDLSEDIVPPSCNVPKQLPELTQPIKKQISVSSRCSTNTENNLTRVATPTTNKYNISSSTQTDLSITDAQEELLKNIESKRIDITKINRMFTNDDYFATYPDPNERYNTEGSNDENDNMNRLMTTFEHQALLTGFYVMAQEQANLHWLSSTLMNSAYRNPNKCTITELTKGDQSEQQQELQIEGQQQTQGQQELFAEFNVPQTSSARNESYINSYNKVPKQNSM